jgi:hypothetical protein
MRLRPEVVGIVVAVPAAILLAACGSSSTTTSSSAAPTTSASVASTTSRAATGNFNSCSVVTRAEAASAIGESVPPGVLGNATVEGGLACVFYGPSAPTPATPNVAQPDSVRVVAVEGSHALAWYNDYKSKVHAQPINGFGDQAYYDGYASLSVPQGRPLPPDRRRPCPRSAVPVRRGEARHRHPAEVVVGDGPGRSSPSWACGSGSGRLGRFLLDFLLTGSFWLGRVTGRLEVQVGDKVSAASTPEPSVHHTTRPR